MQNQPNQQQQPTTSVNAPKQGRSRRGRKPKSAETTVRAPAPVGLVESGMPKKEHDWSNSVCSIRAHQLHSVDPANPNRIIVTHRGKDLLADIPPGTTVTEPCMMAIVRSTWKDVRRHQLTSEIFLNGCYTKGIKGHSLHGEKIVECFHLRYALSPHQFKTLVDDYPHLYFITGTEKHDHPVAHTRAIINSDKVFNMLAHGTVEQPKLYIDMHGNPASNMKANTYTHTRKIATVVERITPKDYLRAAEKWGPDWESDPTVFEHTDRDWMMDDGAATALKELTQVASGYVSIHTLYYYERRFLANLLSRKKGSMLYALVHRFPDRKGKLNDGEQLYTKERIMDTDFVFQPNVLTGESYSHPDIEWLFNSQAWCANGAVGSEPGLAWTITLASPDSYIIKMTSCPAKAVMMSLGAPKPHQRRDVEQFLLEQDNLVEVKLNGFTVPLEVKAHKSYKQMLMFAAGKARTAEQFKDHLAATKRSMKKNEEEEHDPTPVALASFLKNFEMDKHITMATMGSNLEASRSLESCLKGHAPLGARNMLDKVLAVGILGGGMLKGSSGKNMATTLRVAREMLASNGQTANV